MTEPNQRSEMEIYVATNFLYLGRQPLDSEFFKTDI